MSRVLRIALVVLFIVGCGGQSEEAGEQYAEAAAPLIQVTAPDPLPVPESKTVSADDDWAAKAHNKNIEVVQVINIINPVAAYITEGFNQYGGRFSPTLQEEWTDTQAQLTAALGLYETCKARMEAGDADKQLFLDLEEVWQLLVKTGVAGVRTKQMVDAEVAQFRG